MIEREEQFRHGTVLRIAEKMCLAARTAPKAKGLDLLEIAVVEGDEIAGLSAKMRELGEVLKRPGMVRDSENIKNAEAIVLLGTRTKTIGLNCGFCGRPSCAAAENDKVICAYNPGDLGIAVGSAVSVAADNRLDCRIMYSVGKAALALGLLDKGTAIALGIPLSATAKNPFFDREVKK